MYLLLPLNKMQNLEDPSMTSLSIPVDSPRKIVAPVIEAGLLLDHVNEISSAAEATGEGGLMIRIVPSTSANISFFISEHL
jgi:hypothetical protein